MPSNNHTEMIARLHVQGKPIAEIARRMGRDAGFIKAILKQNDTKAIMDRLQEQGEGSNSLAEALHDDDKREIMGRLKTKALEVLETVMEKANDGTKQLELAFRGALWVLERDAVVQEEIKAAQAGGTLEGQPLMQPVYIDKRAMKALERIAEEFSGPDWMEKLEKELNEMPPGAE